MTFKSLKFLKMTEKLLILIQTEHKTTGQEMNF